MDGLIIQLQKNLPWSVTVTNILMTFESLGSASCKQQQYYKHKGYKRERERETLYVM